MKRSMILGSVAVLVWSCPGAFGRDANGENIAARPANEVRPAGALSGASIFVSPGHGWMWDDERGWRTQRGVTYGVIEDHSNAEAVLQYLVPYLWNAGATVYTMRERCLNPNTVIVEPGGEGLVLEGNWDSDRLPGTWNGALYSHPVTDGPATARAIYTPEIPEDGYYGVYLWYRPAVAGKTATDTRILIRHSGGETLWTQNQNRGGHTWKYVGAYHFEAGTDSGRGAVIIENTSGDPDARVVAGAVRFGGGMGDTLRGGRTSGRPRWEESGRYYATFSGFDPEGDARPYTTVTAMPMFAEWLMEPHEAGKSVYVSWHTNASAHGRARGTGSRMYGRDAWGGLEDFAGHPGGVELATNVHDRIVAAVRANYDPEWRDHARVTRWLGEINPRYNNRMPAALFEIGFHDNPQDAAALLDPVFRDTAAKATYAGIVDYFANEVPGFTNRTILPERPAGLSVRYFGGGKAEIAWDEPPFNDGTDRPLGDRATSYRLYRSPNGYGFDNGRDVPGRTATVTGLKGGQTLFFRVTARNAGGESFPSATLALRVPEGPGGPRALLVNGFHRLDRAMNFFEGEVERGILSRMNTWNYSVQHALAADRPGLQIDGACSRAVRAGRVDLAAYDAVFWIMGRETAGSFSLDAGLRERLRRYIENGGALMMSGTDIGTTLLEEEGGREFLRNVFRAEPIAGDGGSHTVVPAAGTDAPRLRKIRFDDGSGPLYHAARPDVFSPVEGGRALLAYADGKADGAAAVVREEGSRALLLGFPFETIEDKEARRVFMQWMLDFLLPGAE